MLCGMSQHEASYVLEVFSVVGLVMSNYNMFSLAGHSIVLSLSWPWANQWKFEKRWRRLPPPSQAPTLPSQPGRLIYIGRLVVFTSFFTRFGLAHMGRMRIFPWAQLLITESLLRSSRVSYHCNVPSNKVYRSLSHFIEVWKAVEKYEKPRKSSTVDGGRWTVGGGRWTVDCGRWTVDGGRWSGVSMVPGGLAGSRATVDGVNTKQGVGIKSNDRWLWLNKANNL